MSTLKAFFPFDIKTFDINIPSRLIWKHNTVQCHDLTQKDWKTTTFPTFGLSQAFFPPTNLFFQVHRFDFELIIFSPLSFFACLNSRSADSLCHTHKHKKTQTISLPHSLSLSHTHRHTDTATQTHTFRRKKSFLLLDVNKPHLHLHLGRGFFSSSSSRSAMQIFFQRLWQRFEF